MHPRIITIVASGTRGDIQPLLALGRGLQTKGNTVRFVTHEPFRALVEQAELLFVPLAGDLGPLLDRATEAGAFAIGSRPLHNLRASLHYLRDAQSVFASMIHNAWQHCKGSHALVVTLPTLWAVQIAEALRIPCVVALFQPLAPTEAFASPLLPITRLPGPTANRASHRVTLRLLWLPWRAVLRRWRKHALGLGSPMPNGVLQATERVRAQRLYGISPRVVPRPNDWPVNHHVTGFWFFDTPAWQPPEALQRFLYASSAPIYIGFGSMGELQTAELHAISATLEAQGMRAVIAWQGASPISLPPTMLSIGPTPHDWLFPQVAAAMHHGGAGTTAAALRAGVPQIVAPVAVDQFFWSQRIRNCGVGVHAGPRRALTPERIAHALAAASVREVRANAALLGYHIRAENGVEQAVELVRDHIV